MRKKGYNGEIIDPASRSTEASSNFAQDLAGEEDLAGGREEEKVASNEGLEKFSRILFSSKILDILFSPVHTPRHAFLRAVYLEQTKTICRLQGCKTYHGIYSHFLHNPEFFRLNRPTEVS